MLQTLSVQSVLAALGIRGQRPTLWEQAVLIQEMTKSTIAIRRLADILTCHRKSSIGSTHVKTVASDRLSGRVVRRFDSDEIDMLNLSSRRIEIAACGVMIKANTKHAIAGSEREWAHRGLQSNGHLRIRTQRPREA